MFKNISSLLYLLVAIVLVFVSERSEALTITDSNPVYLADDKIMLRDIFPKSARPYKTVMAAPAPGKSFTLSLSQLIRITQNHGIDWTPTANFSELVISRIGRDLDRDKLNAAIEKSLKRKITKKFDAIKLDTRFREQDIVLPVKGDISYRIKQISYNTHSKHFKGLAELRSTANNDKITISFSGTATLQREALVLIRSVPRAGIIRPTDLAIQLIDNSAMNSDILTHPQNAIGMQARYRLKADQPLHPRDVQMPLIVKKRQKVVMILATEKLKISTQGIALEDGAQGDIISVRNVSSGIVVEGIISGLETVIVSSISKKFDQNTADNRASTIR